MKFSIKDFFRISFRVNLHSVVEYRMSRNSLLETDAISEVSSF